MAPREWTWAKTDTLCGFCGQRIGRGEAVQLVRLKDVRRVRVRCQQCADGPVPDYIPEAQRTHLEAAEVTARIASIRPFVHDGKALAVADA